MFINKEDELMKKLLFFLAIVLISIVIIVSKYYTYKNKYSEINSYNSQYEKYSNSEISGIDLTTVINKAVDSNERNFVDKDDSGNYIENDTNSINIDVKITDLDEDIILPMETIYDGGMSRFIEFYDSVNFKCTEVKYNSEKKICYMLFEQIA